MSAVARTGYRIRARETARRGMMPAFYAVTLAFLGFLLLAMNEPMRFVYLAWTPDYALSTHRVHHVMIGGLLTLLVVSVAVQLYRPAERVGAYLLAALAVGSLVVVTLLASGLGSVAELVIFVVPLAVIGLLHPGLRSFRPTRASLDVRTAALAAVAAIALIAFAALQVNLHLTLSNDHVTFDHYVMMAAGALTIALGALVASFRPTGWRFLVYGSAVLVTLVGIASAAYPDPIQGLNFGVLGGALAVVWAIVFVATAEIGGRRDDTDAEPRDPIA